MGESKPAPVRPPKLPDAAPQDLRDFVSCKRLDVVLRLDQLGWLPRPPLIPESMKPTVTLTPGSTPNSAEASIGWDILSLTLPVSIGNGQLHVDTTNVPDLEGMRSGIDTWVKRFNDSLAANGKRLDGLQIKGQEVRLTKAVVAAPPGGTAIAPPTPGTAQPPKPTPPPSVPQSPAPTPSDGAKPGNGCIAGLLGSVLVIGLAVGAFFVFGDDDTPDATPVTDQISQPAAAPSATQPTPSDPPTPIASDPPATDPSDTACGTTVERVVGYTNLELAEICLLITEEKGCLETGPDECEEPEPMAVFGGDVGITHDGSVPDAVTGQPGPSQAEFQLFVITQVLGSMRIASNCSGTLLTGESPVEPGTVTIVRHPFRQFGPCTVDEVTFTTEAGAYSYPPSLFGDNGAYTVDAGVVAPGVPPTPTLIAAGGAPRPWNGAGSTVAVLSGGDDLIEWRYQPAAAPYNEGNDWNLFAYTGGDLNALGQLSPDQSALDVLSLAPLFLGDGTTAPFFPCGPGQVGYTACPPGAAPFDSGGLVVVSVVNDAPIPLFPDEALQLDIDFSAGGGPLYSVIGGVDGWSLNSAAGFTNARAIVRGNSLTFVVPPIELGGARAFTVRTIEEENTITHPGVAISNLLTSPRIDLPGVPPPEATETIQQFFAELSTSLSVGDASFALGRLAPLVTDVYGADQCAATLAGRINPQFNIVVIEEMGVGPWDWILPSGESHPVADAYTVTIDLTTGDGVTQRVDSHVIRMENLYRWFTICE